MRKIIILLLSISITALSFAQTCTEGRYKTNIFNTVITTSDIQYGANVDRNGSNVNLTLDIYQPTCDTTTNRALIVMAHGGSFVGGSKTGEDVVSLCTDLARKGYVVASIDYRIGMNGIPFPGPDSAGATEAVFRAVQDGRAAVRFFRKDFVENANSYGIDTSMIFFGGVSAGGFVALHLAYLNEVSEIPSYIDSINQPGLGGGLEGYSGNPGYSSKVKAVVNMQGALGDTAWITPNSIPSLNLHGNQDGTVPYNSATLYMLGFFAIMEVDGSSSVALQADAQGVYNCYKEFNGADHVPHCCGHPNATQYYDTTITYITNFLAEFTCGQVYNCSYQPIVNIVAGDSNGNGIIDGSELIGDLDNNGQINGAELIGDLNGNGIIDCDELASGIENLNPSIAGFEVYPNPATNFITIRANLKNGASFIVFDVLGNKVLSNSFNGANATVDVSSLNSGYYFIQLNDDTGSVTQKVIIE